MRSDTDIESGGAPRTWRERRLAHLAEQVAAGTYSVPPIDVAHAMLFGRPRWGDNPCIMVESPTGVVVRTG